MKTPWEQRWRRFGRGLGDGGQGTIARVIERDVEQRHGVLKILKDSHQENVIARQSFHKECTILARVSNDGVPQLLDSNSHEHANLSVKDLYYVRRFVDGLALNEFILGAKYSIDECVLFILRLLDVIEELHLAQPPIYHRDIKPSNIIVRGKLDPVLIDFGAGFTEDGQPNADIRNEPGIVGNAFLRMRAETDRVPAMDVSHCCGILFYLLTNRDPQHVTTERNALPHRNGSFTWVVGVSEGDRAQICTVLDRGLSIRYTERFADTCALRESLQLVLDKLEAVSPRTLLARSSLSSYAVEEFLLERLRLQQHSTELMQVIADFVDGAGLSDIDSENLRYSEILGKGLNIHSMADGQPLIELAAFKDIEMFLNKAKDAEEDHDALRAALQFYPAISNYVRRRLLEHRQAVLNAAQRDAVQAHQAFLAKMQDELTMRNIDAHEIAAYQAYIDAINSALDSEFFAVKQLLYPWVWKFGACIFWTAGEQSSHRLFRIPQGSNSPLLMKIDEEQFADWLDHVKKAQEKPLGEWSNFFDANPMFDATSTSFMRQPGEHGEEFIYKNLVKVIDAQALPLHGDLLRAELLFEFVDLFQNVLGMEAGDEIDVAALQNCIKRQHDRLDRHTQSATKCTASLVHSTCESLLLAGQASVRRPYQMYSVVPVLLSRDANIDMLRQNLSTILTKSIDEYKSFVSGNGFYRVKSPKYLNEDVSIVYYINIQQWIATEGMGFVQHCCVRNEDRHFSKIEVVFGDAQPGPNFTIAVKGRSYRASSGTMINALKIFSRHPLRDRVYEMFRKDAEVSYDPSHRRHAPSSPYLEPRID